MARRNEYEMSRPDPRRQAVVRTRMLDEIQRKNAEAYKRRMLAIGRRTEPK
jgi:hypothetical protein